MTSGKSHWLLQRITAIILIFLSPCFYFSLLSSFIEGHSFNKIYFTDNYFYTVFFIFFILSIFYHSYLGIISITYDYVQNTFMRNIINYTIAFLLIFIHTYIIYSIFN